MALRYEKQEGIIDKLKRHIDYKYKKQFNR